jgi:hypothetical protein
VSSEMGVQDAKSSKQQSTKTVVYVQQVTNISRKLTSDESILPWADARPLIRLEAKSGRGLSREPNANKSTRAWKFLAKNLNPNQPNRGEMSQLKPLRIACLGLVLVLAGCGQSSSSLPNGSTSSNTAELSGDYAFTFNGITGGPGYSAVFAAVGRFTADGAGNLTKGEVDTNGIGAGAVLTAQTFTGTYSIGADHRGAMSMNIPGGAKLAFAMMANGNAHFIEADAVGGTGTIGSGIMVGNSLLLEGVDVDRLQKLTSGRIRISPIFLEATGYYDWFYGLQGLFRQGSRPQIIVLGVGVNNFLADSVRQDYVPFMLFGLRDSLDVASELKMDRTATSNLLLSHASVFWDTRSVFRTQILRHAIPHYRELVLLLKPQPVIPPNPEFQAIANPRVVRLRELCKAYGARLIILVPPTPSSENATRQMATAAQSAQVEALIPIDPGALSTKYYQPDELHLNSEGAELFTTALATILRDAIGRNDSASPH